MTSLQDALNWQNPKQTKIWKMTSIEDELNVWKMTLMKVEYISIKSFDANSGQLSLSLAQLSPSLLLSLFI
jgi:hypothetical protein